MGKNYQNYLNVNSEIMETKKCTACGSVLPISEFSHHPKTADGLCNVCMSCRSAKISKGKKKQQPGSNPQLAHIKSIKRTSNQILDYYKKSSWSEKYDALNNVFVDNLIDNIFEFKINK